MAVKVHNLGPGSITVGAAPLEFCAEVIGVQIQHEYEEVGETTTRLCGDQVPGTETRIDSVTAELNNDVSTEGLYAYLMANDLTDQPFEYTPNTELGETTPATWTGTVRVKLPESIGADEYASPIAGSIEWQFVGHVVFTPADVPAVPRAAVPA